MEELVSWREMEMEKLSASAQKGSQAIPVQVSMALKLKINNIYLIQ